MRLSDAAIVRPARADERFAVLGLCARFHAASGIPFAFNPAHASRSAQAFIEGIDRLCLVLEVGGALRGVLAASTSISPLAPVRIAQEVVFWVDPDHRGRSPLRMIAAYEDWARAQGCVAVGLACLDDLRVSRLFEISGFARAENSFLKMLG